MKRSASSDARPSKRNKMEKLLVLSDDDVRDLLPMKEAIEVNAAAFQALDREDAVVPTRVVLPVPEYEGSTLFKPAHVKGSALGLKVVSVRPQNAAAGLPTVPGSIMLVDEITGIPTAIVAATYLTALRTAAGSGAATRVLANPDASKLVVFGAGAQARAHVSAMSEVRSLSKVTIVNRTVARAEDLARDLSAALNGVDISVAASKEDITSAVREADLICTTTNTSEPLFDGSDLRPGVHINAIGAYTPAMQELDCETVRRAITVVDNAAEEIFSTTGDYGIPLRDGVVTEACIVGQLGALLSGAVKGRSSVSDITVFKSVGNAVQDVATASAVVRKYRNQD